MFSTIFILANLFRFSPEMAANHKFFNLWLILSNGFTAYLLYRLFHLGWWGRIATAVLLFFLTISGVIDTMPIKNDSTITFQDVEKQPLAKWIMKNTDPHDVFLTTIRIYNPVSFTGRKAMIGWPYFAWSSGYSKPSRGKLVEKIYGATSKEELCTLLRENQIDYVITEKQTEKDPMFRINEGFFNLNFKPVYTSILSDLEEKIFSTKDMCKKED